MSVLAVVGCGNNNNANSIEDRIAQEKYLTEGMCCNPEEVDRHLLQQTWFHSENFENVAMVFGQYSFSYYKTPGDFENHTEGAFCIDRKDLKIKYFKTTFQPNGIEFNKDSIITIKFGAKIKPLATDILKIIKLTTKKLAIKIHSTNEEQTFYRRN